MKALVALSGISGLLACKNMGNSGHTSVSHPHAQFPDNYNIEDIIVSNFCYKKHKDSCPTCHTEGLLSYSCSFCIENTCERETCGSEWNWMNNLEECREKIILEETLSLDLDKLQAKYQALLDGDLNQFKSIQNGTTVPDNLNLNQNGIKSFSNSTFLSGWLTGKNRDSTIRFESSNTDSGPTDLEIFCPKMQSRLTVSNDEIQVVAPDRFQTRCYVNCPDGFITYGRRCYSKCKITPKDELSLFCIEPEIRKPIALFSSCAEDCTEQNIKDFCFACPIGMYKKDCQCIKDEIIEFREIVEREHRPAIVLIK